MKTIIISAGLLLPQLNYQATIEAINKNILPANKQLDYSNIPAIMASFMSIDQAFNHGKINTATFKDRLGTLFCEKLDLDTLTINDDNLTSSWNAMLGDSASLKELDTAVQTLQTDDFRVVLISETNPLHKSFIETQSTLGQSNSNVSYITTFDTHKTKAKLFEQQLEKYPNATVILGNSEHINGPLKSKVEASNKAITDLANKNSATVYLIDPRQDFISQLRDLNVVKSIKSPALS